MLKVEKGYLCLYNKKYSDLNTIERYIFSEELRNSDETSTNKKTTPRSGKTEV